MYFFPYFNGMLKVFGRHTTSKLKGIGNEKQSAQNNFFKFISYLSVVFQDEELSNKTSLK